MNLKLVRKEYRVDGVFGELQSESGEVLATTLEHAYANDSGGFEPKTPPGNYECVKGTHRLESMVSSFETFEIKNVPNHTNILFHFGNYNKDSDGCVLLGKDVLIDNGVWMVTYSRGTFAKFMELQKNVDSFTLQVMA